VTRLIENGKLILEDGICEKGAVLVRDGYIEGIFTDTWDLCADERVDAEGMFISPGFIDTHIHGGGGYDVMDASYDSLYEIARVHKKHGCTAFLPTTLTASKERIKAAVRSVYDFMNSKHDGARVLGVHLEGPCFNYKYKGAQNPDYLVTPSIDFLMNLIRVWVL